MWPLSTDPPKLVFLYTVSVYHAISFRGEGIDSVDCRITFYYYELCFGSSEPTSVVRVYLLEVLKIILGIQKNKHGLQIVYMYIEISIGIFTFILF